MAYKRCFPHIKTANGLKFIANNGMPMTPWCTNTHLKYLMDNYRTKPNDVFLISYPKAGQHLLKKICLELVRHHDKKNTHSLYADADIGFDAIPSMEILFAKHEKVFNDRIELLKDTFNFWHTHNPCSFFPANKNLLHSETKYIVINRHPKDLLISYWQWVNNVGVDFGGAETPFTLNKFMDRFISGTMYYGCYYQWTLDWFNAYNNDIFNGNKQMLWIYYEDIINEPLDTVEHIKNFLYPNDDIVSDDDLKEIVKLIEFNKMKKHYIENPQSFHMPTKIYFRSGKVDDWKKYLNDEQSELLDEIMWIKWSDKGTDIKYYSEVMAKYQQKCDFGYHSDLKNCEH